MGGHVGFTGAGVRSRQCWQILTNPSQFVIVWIQPSGVQVKMLFPGAREPSIFKNVEENAVFGLLAKSFSLGTLAPTVHSFGVLVSITTRSVSEGRHRRSIAYASGCDKAFTWVNP
jgi:hypothetical protein